MSGLVVMVVAAFPIVFWGNREGLTCKQIPENPFFPPPCHIVLLNEEGHLCLGKHWKPRPLPSRKGSSLVKINVTTRKETGVGVEGSVPLLVEKVPICIIDMWIHLSGGGWTCWASTISPTLGALSSDICPPWPSISSCGEQSRRTFESLVPDLLQVSAGIMATVFFWLLGWIHRTSSTDMLTDSAEPSLPSSHPPS